MKRWFIIFLVFLAMLTLNLLAEQIPVRYSTSTGKISSPTAVDDIAGTSLEITVMNGADVVVNNGSNVVLSLPAVIDLGGKTSLEIPNATSVTVNAAGEIAIDSNGTSELAQGIVEYYDGTQVMYGVALDALPSVDGELIQYDATLNKWVLTTIAEFSLPAEIDFGDNTSLQIPNSTGPTVNAAGEIAIDTNGVTDYTQGILTFYDGTQQLYVVALDATPTVNGGIISYNSTTDKWTLSTVAAALTGAIDLGGSTSLEIPNNTNPTVTGAAGIIAIDTNGDANITQGLIKYYDGTNTLYAVAIDATPTVGQSIIKYNSTTDKWTIGLPSTAVTATDGATITFDFTAGLYQEVTLGGNRTIAEPTGEASYGGQEVVIVLIQDGTGSRTVTWHGVFTWTGGTAPTLTTTAAKRDIFGFRRGISGLWYNTWQKLNL